jgi:hypothetical protein
MLIIVKIIVIATKIHWVNDLVALINTKKIFFI